MHTISNSNCYYEGGSVRITEQRRIILEELMSRTDHPTADAIYAAVKTHIPRISLGTVYRNLERLALDGEVMRLESGSGQMHFDGNRLPHPHFRCLACGRIEDVPMQTLSAGRDDAVRKVDGEEMLACKPSREWLREREVFAVSVEYTGYCPQCAASERNQDEG